MSLFSVATSRVTVLGSLANAHRRTVATVAAVALVTAVGLPLAGAATEAPTLKAIVFDDDIVLVSGKNFTASSSVKVTATLEGGSGATSATSNASGRFMVGFSFPADYTGVIRTTAVIGNTTKTAQVTIGESSSTTKSPTVTTKEPTSTTTSVKASTTTTAAETTSTTSGPKVTVEPTTTIAKPATGHDWGMVSITLDDGTIGQFNNARPILNSHGFDATYYIVSDALGWGASNINPAQAKQLVAEGHEIGSHTVDHRYQVTTGASAAEINAEFGNSLKAIKDKVGVTPVTCAYPGGQHNAAVEAEAAKFYKACRGGNSGNPQNASNYKPYAFDTMSVLDSTTTAQVLAAVQKAKATNSWLTLTYHGVNAAPNGEYSVTTAQFAAQMDAIKSTGIPVRTVAGALAYVGK